VRQAMQEDTSKRHWKESSKIKWNTTSSAPCELPSSLYLHQAYGNIDSEYARSGGKFSNFCARFCASFSLQNPKTYP
jgi:hypothetical protein